VEFSIVDSATEKELVLIRKRWMGFRRPIWDALGARSWYVEIAGIRVTICI
jgi:hypothetical protein